MRQVSGHIARARDGSGLRRYLCVGDRQYVVRANAPLSAWVAEARRLIRERHKWDDMTRLLLAEMQERFGAELPEDLLVD